mmetsp:Transcript_14042/g.40316  ORF Transcript_14042/g.40316 Transcript_14042/m.40316 type:complete len:247 (-) Transcript_14042:131-871(-)
MDVVFQMVRGRVVDDAAACRYVEAATGHRRGNEDVGSGRILKVGYRRVSVFLFLAAVQRQGGISTPYELLEEVVGTNLRINEHNDLLLVRHVLSENLEETKELVFLLNDLAVLGDGIRCHGSTSDQHLNGELERLPRQSLHSLGKGCGKENSLTIGPDGRQDGRYLRTESHVEEPIGLVHHHVRNALEGKDLAGLHGEDVNHSTRRGNDDVRAALEVTNLFRYAGTAVHCGGSEKSTGGKRLMKTS